MDDTDEDVEGKDMSHVLYSNNSPLSQSGIRELATTIKFLLLNDEYFLSMIEVCVLRSQIIL